VLNHRKSREDEALAALAKAQRVFQHEKARKSQLQAQLAETLLARREGLGSVPTEGLHFQLETEFVEGTKRRIIQQDQAILRASRGVEKALRAYLHCRRQTRTMEHMREKAFRDFRTEMNKREQKELDDMTVMRARFREEMAL
jgi:flagellar export protein FliJ